ncbi:unnamed protein product [Trichogramma brassicae]|uniref:Reverse transcriptase domain-containing protein n=1 Tax=Trichogramma brassicae TaxID=86971 RepID=A0A6H5J1T6_9HYME|nr:unnamed protein product [Trichogramma brassicae]
MKLCINKQNNQCPTYRLAKILDEELKSRIKRPASQVTNSMELKKLIGDYSIPEDYVLLSLDVSALFTNVSLELVLASLDKRWHTLCASILPFDVIRDLTIFLFENTYFVFNDIFYRQKYGTPMGSPISQLFADVVMDDLETFCLSELKKHQCNPIFYFRYVDDTVICVKREHIDLVHKTFNGYDKNLQFTHETRRTLHQWPLGGAAPAPTSHVWPPAIKYRPLRASLIRLRSLSECSLDLPAATHQQGRLGTVNVLEITRSTVSPANLCLADHRTSSSDLDLPGHFACPATEWNSDTSHQSRSFSGPQNVAFKESSKFMSFDANRLVLLQRVTNLAIRLNNAALCGTRIFDVKCCLSTRVHQLFNRIKIAKFIFSHSNASIMHYVGSNTFSPSVRNITLRAQSSLAYITRSSRLLASRMTLPHLNSYDRYEKCHVDTEDGKEVPISTSCLRPIDTPAQYVYGASHIPLDSCINASHTAQDELTDQLARIYSFATCANSRQNLNHPNDLRQCGYNSESHDQRQSASTSQAEWVHIYARQSMVHPNDLRQCGYNSKSYDERQTIAIGLLFCYTCSPFTSELKTERSSRFRCPCVALGFVLIGVFTHLYAVASSMLCAPASGMRADHIYAFLGSQLSHTRNARRIAPLRVARDRRPVHSRLLRGHTLLASRPELDILFRTRCLVPSCECGSRFCRRWQVPNGRRLHLLLSSLVQSRSVAVPAGRVDSPVDHPLLGDAPIRGTHSLVPCSQLAGPDRRDIEKSYTRRGTRVKLPSLRKCTRGEVSGDHLGVFPCNNENMVDNILRRLENSFDFDTPIDLQIQKQVHTPNVDEYIFFGDGSRRKVLGRGKITISRLIDGKWFDGELNGVLYVPSFNVNLVSIGVCKSKGMEVVHKYNVTKFLSKNSVLLAQGVTLPNNMRSVPI